MIRVETSFHAELNDFLSRERRGRPVAVEVSEGTTVKDLVESLGVPHTEIDVVVVNGESVDFSRRVADGDRVSVYPVLEATEVSPIVHLRPPAPGEPRFVLDVHLGRLARYLRLLGFDALWRNDLSDEELVRRSAEEDRVLLTRDRGLLKRAAVRRGCFVRETAPRGQIVEVLRRHDLFGAVSPFSRCLECNARLQPVAKEEVEDRLPSRIRRDYRDFRRCPGCGRVYWRGSHYDRLRLLVDDICSQGGHGAPPPPAPSPPAAALAAWERGWSVVPLHSVVRSGCSCGEGSCPAVGKHPRIAWQRFMHERPAREEVEGWWRQWPRANLGVVTGAVSSLVVLDVDPRHGGDDTLAELERVNGALPLTVESLTGGGGQHLYFRHPGLGIPSRQVAPGLDVKGDGGLVVAPPSVHPSGRAYLWETGRSPEALEPAAMPPWLLALALDQGGPLNGRPRGRREAVPRSEAERRAFAEMWAEVGIKLRAGDHNYLCPFHPDHHPSLHIDADGCRFYCFGCARGGGIGRLRRLLVLQVAGHPRRAP